MSKMVNQSRAKYCIQWESHSKHSLKGLCSLMEHQSLVDIAICCGNNTLHAHKCVLAACSSLFREELEKNPSTEQVIVTGCDFPVMKSIIEIIYCGETIISEEYLKYLAAAAKTFEMKSLEHLFTDRNKLPGDEVYIPRPQFISKKPKYPSAYNPYNTQNYPPPNNMIKPLLNYNLNDQYNQRKLKRRYVRSEAEKACAKEAQASRMALATLQKEIASAPQVNSFIIEDSCTETTVENFIPHTEDMQDMPIHVVDYCGVNPVYLQNNRYLSGQKTTNRIHLSSTNNASGDISELTTNKIKDILGHELPNVEIMFKTSEGKFVSVTDDVLENISKCGLQYQVVDENGLLGEPQDLQVMGKESNKDSISQNEKNINQDLSKSNSSNNTSFLTANNSTIVSDTSSGQDEILGYPIATGQEYGSNKQVLNEIVNKELDIIELNNPEYIHVENGTDIISNRNENSMYNFNDIFITGYSSKRTNDNSIDENSERSLKKSKFSPDMFFADLTNQPEREIEIINCEN